MLVYDGDEAVGWCQFGTPDELPNIKNVKAYDKELVALPQWRIGCIFTGSKHRGKGVARAVTVVLDEIAVPPHRSRDALRGPRVRARPADRHWRWVMRREVEGA